MIDSVEARNLNLNLSSNESFPFLLFFCQNLKKLCRGTISDEIVINVVSEEFDKHLFDCFEEEGNTERDTDQLLGRSVSRYKR